MAVAKFCAFATLVAAVLFAALRMLSVETWSFAPTTFNLRSSDPAVRNVLFRYGDTPSSRSHSDPTTDPTNFLPVQSKNPKELGTGKLLVASRDIGDPSFAESVILLVQYEDEGVVGLMINRPTKLPVSRALNQVKGAKDRTDPVYFGGPVEIPAVFALLHSKNKPEGAGSVLDGVYLVTSKTLLEKILADRPEADAFHVYLGYAGWNKSQLYKELAMGMWFVFRGDTRTIFDANPNTLWRELIKQTELKFAGNQAAVSNASGETAQGSFLPGSFELVERSSYAPELFWK